MLYSKCTVWGWIVSICSQPWEPKLCCRYVFLHSHSVRLLCSLSVFQLSFRSNGARFWNPCRFYPLPFLLLWPFPALLCSLLTSLSSLRVTSTCWSCNVRIQHILLVLQTWFTWSPCSLLLRRLSFQPWWYKLGRNVRKYGCNRRMMSFHQRYKEYYVKNHFHSFPNKKTFTTMHL